jgi:hypothetical protein
MQQSQNDDPNTQLAASSVIAAVLAAAAYARVLMTTGASLFNKNKTPVTKTKSDVSTHACS